MAIVKLDNHQLAGLNAILNWGPANFHKLTQDNKVKMWLKVYDKITPDKLDVSLSLADELKKARARAAGELLG